MKNLSEVLDQLPALQHQPESAPPVTSAALSDEAVEALLLSISQQQQRQQIRQPLDLQLLFKFGCLGLGAVFAGVAALVAYWNRPVNAIAQAQTLESVSAALVQSQAQVQQVIETANPPEYKCGARLFGDCNFPEQNSPPASIQTAEMPMQPTHYGRAAQTLQASPSPVGIGVPVLAAAPPEDPAIAQARQQLLAWQGAGYGPAQTVEFIQQLRQRPDPQFPAASDLSIAHVRLYGAQF